MTKVRAPVTIENALRALLGRLQLEDAATITGREAGYLHSMTDPDKPGQITVRDVLLLDLEAHKRFGEGFPLFEAIGRMLESTAGERFADQAAIARVTADFAKESGDAVAASIAAAMPGAGVRELEAALREAEEADQKADAQIAVLRSALKHAREGPPPPPT